MGKLTYFGTPVSPNQIISKQGYLVCMNVPICRTGSQSYLGSELEGHPGYDPAWGLNPNERYDVDRPLEEVTSPATIASFEGNTVVDEHPDSTRYPGSLLTCENDKELNRGHGQNVRVGPQLPESGETCLLADLHVKDYGLIKKIDEQGIREVSCGYTHRLARRDDGTLYMTQIRGNHIAIVPKGRAGSEVAIIDAEPMPKPTKERKPVKDPKNHILGLGLIAACAAKDADPEEVAKMAKEAIKDAEEPKEEAPQKSDKEEAPQKDKKGTKDDDGDGDDKAEQDADEHPKGCRCDDCKPGAAKDAPKLEELEDGKAAVATEDAAEVHIDELGEGELKGKGVLDSARSLVQVLKPLMGSGSMPKVAVDAYNAHVKALNALKGANPYEHFVQVQAPVLATDSASPTKVAAINPRTFFEGRTYAEGLALYNDHLKNGGK